MNTTEKEVIKQIIKMAQNIKSDMITADFNEHSKIEKSYNLQKIDTLFEFVNETAIFEVNSILKKLS